MFKFNNKNNKDSKTTLRGAAKIILRSCNFTVILKEKFGTFLKTKYL